VTGQNDGDDDGHVNYILTLDPGTSADAEYASLPSLLVSAVNRDDDDDSLSLSELDYFEDGNITEYGSSGSDTAFTVTAAAARDGGFGLEGGSGNDWIYRNDAQAQVARGDVFSAWIRSEGDSTGRAYFGFGAKTKGKPSGRGALSIVMAPNSNQLMLQRNVGWGFEDMDVAPQMWEADAWYRFEIEWENNGTITGRLYDASGTWINTVQGTDTDFSSGGIAFRNFGSVRHFDSVELRTGVAASGNTTGLAERYPRIALPDLSAMMSSVANPSAVLLGREPGHTENEASRSIYSPEVREYALRNHDVPAAEYHSDRSQLRPWQYASRGAFSEDSESVLEANVDEDLVNLLAEELAEYFE
jgi:hypothetical protein